MPRQPIPYLYRVQPFRKAGRTRWNIAVIPPVGAPSTLMSYASFGKAFGTAKTLALGGGMVEVCA